MKRYCLILLLGFSGLFVKDALAQDIHFSQFWAQPLLLNPANTGNFEGDFRIAAIYRDQWRSIAKKDANVTIAGSFDRLFHIKEEKLGGGVAVFNDESGVGDLNTTKALISLAYHKDIKKNTLRVGISAGYVNKRIGKDGLTFPNDFNDNPNFGAVFIESDTSQNRVDEKKSSWDMAVGIGWGRKLENFKSELGLGFFHINKPKELLLNDPEGDGPNPRMRMVFTGSGHWDMTEKIFLLPGLLLMYQSRAVDFEFGSNVGYRLKENKIKAKAVYGGAFFRYGIPENGDALIGVVGLQIGRFDFGVSYDVNVSELTEATNYKGAFEFSLIYIAPAPQLKEIEIPCDRF